MFWSSSHPFFRMPSSETPDTSQPEPSASQEALTGAGDQSGAPSSPLGLDAPSSPPRRSPPPPPSPPASTPPVRPGGDVIAPERLLEEPTVIAPAPERSTREPAIAAAASPCAGAECYQR